MIEIEHLSKYYGRRRAVGPLSATIDKGEVVGLLGLNGAGKTTTLRVLACDLLPSAGTVKVDGIDVVERPDLVRERIGYLPDSPPVYDEMRVGEYLTFVFRLRGKSASQARTRVPEVAERTGLKEALREPLFSLSHGFRQRVGIAQAIVHNPAFVVLDEPISGLDPVQIVEMRSLVRQLGEDHTVLVSSHILSEISETCDRLLVIGDGTIVASGTEEQLRGRLLHGLRIELSVRASAEQVPGIVDLLRETEGVRHVERIEAREAGDDVVSFAVYAQQDVREDLGSRLFAAGCRLLELVKAQSELEDVFLRLTQNASADRPSASDGGPPGAAAGSWATSQKGLS